MGAGRRWPWIAPVRTLETVWPYVRPDRWALAWSALAVLLLTAIEVSIPLTSRAYVDAITGSRGHDNVGLSADSPNLLIGLLLVAALARGLLLTRQRSLAGRIGEQTAARLRADLWAHIQTLPVEATQRRGPGRLLVRFVSDIRSVQRLVSEVMVQGPQDLIVTVIVLVTLVLLNWWLALPALLLLPAYGVIFWLLNPGLRAQSLAARQRRTRLSAFLNERIVGMKVVKAHGREQAEAARVRRMTQAVAQRGVQVAVTAARLQGAAATVVTVGIAMTLALAPGEIAAGRATGGTLVAFLLLLVHLAPALRRVAQLNRTAQEAHVSLTRLRATLDQTAEVGRAPVTRRLRVRAGVVDVKAVSYAGQDGALVLDRVSLRAERGELVAVVGSTGSGKSTLVDLLLRFKDPSDGRIVIDGRRITNVSIASLRAQVGWVPQEAVLFDGSLRENVAYGARRPPSSQRLDQAIRRAGLSGVVARLPGGMDGLVGAAGQILSYGERQRVALARALIADPPILVVDEIAGGGDAEESRRLAELLRTLSREKTLIVATSQAPILRAADRVYVLERGRPVEQGTHAELIARGAVYPRLVGAVPALVPVPIARAAELVDLPATAEPSVVAG
jgi:ABC-type multidrug transport system fused ATPase/permease subunit